MNRINGIKRILFFTTYPKLAAAPRIRVYYYLPFLAELGIQYRVINIIPSWIYPLSLSGNPWRKVLFYLYASIARFVKILQVILIAPRYDIIYIRGVYFPLRLEKILSLTNPNIVFDLVDAVYLRGNMTKLFSEKVKLAFYNQSILLPRMLSIARAVNIHTPYLKKYVKKYCSSIWITPGPIQLHKCKSHLPKKPHEIVIGWMGSPSTAKYLYDLTEVIRELQQRYSVMSKIIGAGHAYSPPLGLNIIKEDWNLEKEIDQLYSFDVGIMPLRETLWERGKGGFKLLNYMSVGLPVVASPIGINKQLIQDSVNGFFATSQDEWIKKLSLLIENFMLRKKLGMQGWKTVQQYTAEAQFAKIKAILEMAIKD
ncbi:MAG: glycosyltransferase family 4 protein [Candidatus Hodarchaeota archaeon]